MSTAQTIVDHCKRCLPLAAAALAAGLMVRAQAPATNYSPDDANAPASDTTAPASKEAQFGNIIGKVNAGKGISVVWVDAEPGASLPKPAKPFTVSQKNLKFEPHVLAVPAGTTIDFLNGDTVQHNIFWPAISGNKKMAHTLGTWPKGQTRMFQFTTPGIVPLLCNVHPEMSAFVIVTPTPYLAQTDESGSFTISAVPDGSYTVTAWHEGYKTQSKPVTVASDAHVDFTLAK